MDIIEEYRKFCNEYGILFTYDLNVKSYDNSTLFCPAGMQQFKGRFKDPDSKGTIANVQSCIRMNDFGEVGDGTHLLYFNMLGLFSFHEWTVSWTIRFWIGFLDRIGVRPDIVTVHPERTGWAYYYHEYDVKVEFSEDCYWTDGEIGGYSTEFFKEGVEIGNIVNPMGTCIDVGFGLERLERFANDKIPTKADTLREAALKIIEAGYAPSNKEQGYVLRKVLRAIYNEGETLDHPFFREEVKRQNTIQAKYERLKDKFKDKDKVWWYDTHGINLDDINKQYERK